MRTRRWILFFLVMILSISLFLPAFAVTSEASKTAKVPTDAVWYNGHAYMIYTQGKSWKQAKKDCEKKGGHLVTITSAKEQVFVRKLVSGTQRQYWIGITDEGHEGDWRWVTGEKGKYRNWGYGNPDNWDNIQHFGVMYSWAKSWGGTSVKPGQWDDDTYKQSYAYICEWDFGGLPAKVKINGGNKVSKGNKIQLTATVSPSSAAQNVRWISSDTSVATVNSSGVVKGKSAGKVIIAALSKADETVMGSISIQVVEKAVKSIKISCETKRINTKETLVLKANVSPSDAVQNIEWSSSDTKVATISSDGKLTAVGKGKVTITAKAIDGSNKKATVKITVQEGLSSKERKQIVDDVKAKYSNSVVSFIDKENTEITNLNEWFTNEQDDLVAKIDNAIEKAVAIDARLPEEVKTEFLKRLTSLINLQIKTTDYSTCKSVMELMKKVINDIKADKSTFSFECSGTTYIANLTNFSGLGGASIKMGSIQRENGDMTYPIMISNVSNKAVKDTLKSLSKFAQSNMKKACDEALKDLVVTSLDAAKVTEILKDFQKFEVDPIYGMLSTKQPKAVNAIQVGIKALPLLKDPVKIYNAIIDFNLDSVTDEKLTQKADDFAKKLDEFNEAVYDFMHQK